MSYATGETPLKGDIVKSTVNGKIGLVTRVLGGGQLQVNTFAVLGSSDVPSGSNLPCLQSSGVGMTWFNSNDSEGNFNLDYRPTPAP